LLAQVAHIVGPSPQVKQEESHGTQTPLTKNSKGSQEVQAEEPAPLQVMQELSQAEQDPLARYSESIQDVQPADVPALQVTQEESH